jgi:HSP20 family protein
MRVTDLLPRKPARGPASAMRDENDPVASLQSDVNRAFDDFFRWLPVPFSGWPVPLLDRASGMQAPGNQASGNQADVQADVVETDKEVKVTAELPGMEDADIDVRFMDDTLVISGEKKSDREVEENGYVLRERRFGRVERILALPEGIDADAAQARFKNGVLTVTIPKTAEAQAGAKRIPVKPH